MAGQPRKRAKAAAAAQAATEAGDQPALAADQAEPAAPADQAPRPRRQRPRSAPRSAAAQEPAAAEPPRRSPKLRKIHDGLVQLFTLAGLGVGMFVDDYDGQVVVLNADRNARAWTDLAAQSPMVCSALEALLMGSAWGAAIGTTAMTALPILVRHQVLPPDAMAVAIGQGVAVPTIAQPAREQPPPPQSFTPPTPQATEAEVDTEPRHPMDGSPAGAPAPDPTAPAFPQPDHQAAA